MNELCQAALELDRAACAEHGETPPDGLLLEFRSGHGWTVWSGGDGRRFQDAEDAVRAFIDQRKPIVTGAANTARARLEKHDAVLARVDAVTKDRGRP